AAWRRAGPAAGAAHRDLRPADLGSASPALWSVAHTDPASCARDVATTDVAGAVMATILAYTSPALGHLLPMSALLRELSARGHQIHLRTLSAGLATGRRMGFDTEAIDERTEAVVMDDWRAPNARAALKISVDVFCRRAAHEVADLQRAIARVNPDAVIVDVNCWGAQSVADAAGIPWLVFSPYTPFLRSR